MQHCTTFGTRAWVCGSQVQTVSVLIQHVTPPLTITDEGEDSLSTSNSNSKEEDDEEGGEEEAGDFDTTEQEVAEGFLVCIAADKKDELDDDVDYDNEEDDYDE